MEAGFRVKEEEAGHMVKVEGAVAKAEEAVHMAKAEEAIAEAEGAGHMVKEGEAVAEVVSVKAEGAAAEGAAFKLIATTFGSLGRL